MQAFSYINVVTYLSLLILIMSWSCNVYSVSLPPLCHVASRGFTGSKVKGFTGSKVYWVLQLLFLLPDYCRVSDRTEWLSLAHSLFLRKIETLYSDICNTAIFLKKKAFNFVLVSWLTCCDSFRWTVKELSHTYTCIHSPPNYPSI